MNEEGYRYDPDLQQWVVDDDSFDPERMEIITPDEVLRAWGEHPDGNPADVTSPVRFTEPKGVGEQRPLWAYPCHCGHGSEDHHDNMSHTAIPFCYECDCGEFEPNLAPPPPQVDGTEAYFREEWWNELNCICGKRWHYNRFTRAISHFIQGPIQ
jgi:hypothetical protein